MLSLLAAAFLLQADRVDPPAGAMCVQSKYKNGDYITFVVPNEKFNQLSNRARAKSRDFKIIPCRATWTPASTKKLCERIEMFSDDLVAAMTEAYGISPDEMCESAKEVDALQKG